MKKKSDDEFGILITREMKSMMLDSTITYEQRAKIFCAIIADEPLKDTMMKAFADSLKVGYLSTNNKRKAEIFARRTRQKEYAKNLRASTEIKGDERTNAPMSVDARASLNRAKQSKAMQSIAIDNIPPKSPEGGLDAESSTSHEPKSMLDDPSAALGLPAGGTDDDVAKIAAEIEGSYRYKVNRGKLRKCLKSVLKKNSAAEVLDGYRRWLAVWQADDFQWAPSRITDWLYDAKFLEEPRRGNTRAAPQVDPDTVSSGAHLDLV